MPYDATKMLDWQIGEAAEPNMPTPDQWREKLGMKKDEVIPYGKVAKLDFIKIMDRLKNRPDGKYIEVTAITPTPLGEGKTTTTMGIYSANRAKTIAWHRHYTRFWTESLGYCDFIWPNFVNVNTPDMLGATPEGEPKFFNAVTGKGISFVDGMEVGRKIWNLDRAIWALQGRHRDMEVFNEYVYSQPVSIPWELPVYENGKWKYSDCQGRTLDRARFEEWKTRFYELEGWDASSGWSTRGTLEELGLGKVADELQRKKKLGG